MNAKVKDSVRILHILDAIKEIEDYIQGADKDSFANNSIMSILVLMTKPFGALSLLTFPN